MIETTDLNLLQFASADEIKARTDAKLRALVKHAYRNVSYYREIFDKSGVHCSDIKKVEDLHLLPVLSRQTVKDNFQRKLVADGIPKIRRRLTSTTGSTGIPLKFFSDAASNALRSEAWDFLDRWAGIRHGEHNRVWLGAPRPKPRFNLRHPIKSWFERKRFRQPKDLISVFMLKAETVPGILYEMQKRSPYFIYGISSSIRFIAKHIEEDGIALDTSPVSVIGTSDTLLPAHQQHISDIFNCPVYSRYGSYEMGGGVAQTCPDVSESIHVIPELVILEIVDDEGLPVQPGESGNILLTELTNYVMPLIRYDTGDVGIALGPCGCGRGFPAIREIIGRNYEQIQSPSGQAIHGWEFEVYLFYEKDYKKYIAEYQIIQKGNTIVLRVVPAKFFSEYIQNTLRSDLKQMIGEEMVVEVEPVRYIECAQNGKKPLIRIIHDI